MNQLLKKVISYGIVTTVICSSIAGKTGQAKEESEKNVQTNISSKQITTRLPMSAQKYTDHDGNKIYYQWKSVRVYTKDSSKWEKACFYAYIDQGEIKTKKIKFSAATKKYVKKQEIHDTLQWQDRKGNFFFVTEKSDKSKKVVLILHQVDKKGNIVKKINLNEWLKIAQTDNAYYMLFLDSVKKDTVIVSYHDIKKVGYLIMDRNTGKVKKQIVNRDTDNFWLRCANSTKLVGVDPEHRIIVANLSKEKKLTLPSGNKIEYAKAESYIKGETLPQENGQQCYGFGEYKDNIYLLTAAGYYKVNLKNAVCKKIASTDDLAFIHREAKEYGEDLAHLGKDYVTVEIMPVSDKKFYVIEGFWRDEGETNYRKLWLCTIGT